MELWKASSIKILRFCLRIRQEFQNLLAAEARWLSASLHTLIQSLLAQIGLEMDD